MTDVEADVVMKSTRKKVIKLLQEQVDDLRNEQNDVDALKSEVETLNRSLDCQEKMYKLQVEDLQCANDKLEFENHELRSSLLKLQSTVNQKPLVVTETKIKDDVNNYYDKYVKWKTKFKALAKTSPKFAAAAETAKLEFQLRNIMAKFDQQEEALSKAYKDKDKLSRELTRSNDSLKMLQNLMKDYENKNQLLTEENSKHQVDMDNEEKKRKKTERLLAFSRSKEGKQAKDSLDREKLLTKEIKRNEETISDMRKKIEDLTKSLEAETNSKNKFKRKLVSAKEKLSKLIENLEKENYQLVLENKSLIDDLRSLSENSSSLQERLDTLLKENSELQIDAAKASRLRTKNMKLNQYVTELQGNLSSLNKEYNDASMDVTNKADDVKAILARHFSGRDFDGSWNDDLQFISEKFKELEECKREIEDLRKQIKKKDKTLEKCEEANKKLTDNIYSLNNELRQVNSALENRGAEIVPVTMAANGGDKIHSSDSDIPSYTVHTRLTKLDIFRRVIWSKIDKTLFELTNSIKETQAFINQQELAFPSLRSIVLFSICLIHWTKFKRNTPLDKSSEYLFLLCPVSLYPPKTLSDQIREILLNYNNHSQMINRSIMEANEQNQDLSNQISELQSSLDSMSKEYQALSSENENLKRTIDEINIEKSKMIYSEVYNNLENEYNKRTSECTSKSVELNDLKVEMENLLNTIDETHQTSEEQKIRIVGLTKENETLRQQLEAVLLELSNEKTANKEKTKEILSLERQLDRSKGQVAVVKDSIPLGDQAPLQQTKLDVTQPVFFISDAVRNDLLMMQKKLNPTADL